MSKHRVPNDVGLEAQVVGSIIHRYAMCTQLDAHHCYDQRHAAILDAWRIIGRPVGTTAAGRDGDVLHIIIMFDGLVEELCATHPTNAEHIALYAGLLAARAPVTTRRDVARLRLLAYRRRRLARLEEERAALLDGAA